jgi:hypothetical protein
MHVLEFALASSAGLSMGFSLRMGFEKIIFWFLTTRFLSEMPAEEAKFAYNLKEQFNLLNDGF